MVRYSLLSVLFCLLALALTETASPRENEVAVRELRPQDDFDHLLATRLAGLRGLPGSHAAWPRLWTTARDYSGPTLVGTVNGLIVGRCILEAPYHPYCELVNLYVRPDYWGQGVGTALVREAIRRAREMGFKYMVLQEGPAGLADSECEKVGFLKATAGKMQRLLCPLDVPLVSLFLKQHPQATFLTEPAPERGERWWRLQWRDGEDYVALLLHGGSCQSDSDGFEPVVQACGFIVGETGLTASVEAPSEVQRGEPAELAVTLKNLGKERFGGVVRAVLLPDTEVVGELAHTAPGFDLGPGEGTTISLPVRVRHEFPCDAQKYVSYPSTPLTAEVCWGARERAVVRSGEGAVSPADRRGAPRRSPHVAPRTRRCRKGDWAVSSVVTFRSTPNTLPRPQPRTG